ncbi:WhiB family transcriptional regulator [Rhodococcus erythropolis]|uniref:WhiB family transcriptional regulator n=1 Tax=Rhodococcus erythropolis TaxID=1833 RepID=UPI0030136B0E
MSTRIPGSTCATEDEPSEDPFSTQVDCSMKHSGEDSDTQQRSTFCATASLRDWQLQAMCRGFADDPFSGDLFFGPENETKGQRWRRERNAKQICLQCPVSRFCLEFALRTRQRFGIWGGFDAREI